MANKFYDNSFILAHPRAFSFLLGNRNSGKSFSFKTLLLKNYIENKDKRRDCRFMFLYRKVDTVKLASPFLFEDVLDIKFPGHTIKYKSVVNGFGRYYLDEEDEPCGYAMCVKNYQMIKPMAEVQTVELVVYDEFLTENNDYLKNEVDMVKNIYSTIARGGGKFIRENVRFFFLSNTVSMVNPYFREFNINKEIQYNTKRLIRDSYVLEIIHNQNAVDAIMSSNFGQAIKGTKYAQYIMDNSFYSDNNAFIEKITGQKNYMLTIRLGGVDFGVWEQRSKGIVYISEQFDPSYKVYTFDNDDHDVNLILFSQHIEFVRQMRRYYENDAVRFENLDCKMMFLTLIKVV